jgi:hypothetical protein
MLLLSLPKADTVCTKRRILVSRLRAAGLIILQAVKIMCMVFVLWGIMWCLGLMPYQQDPQLLEQRMQQMMQAKQQQQQQQQQQGVSPGGSGGQTEL